MPKPGSEERIDKLPECHRAVRDLMLGVGVHFTKGLAPALGQEHRIIAEAALAARRPDESAMHLAAEILDMAVRPGDREHAHEMRLACIGRCCAPSFELLLDIAHGKGEVLGWSGPACRID